MAAVNKAQAFVGWLEVLKFSRADNDLEPCLLFFVSFVATIPSKVTYLIVTPTLVEAKSA